MAVDGRARRPTSTDVARAAGVSRATVSYVLNDAPHQRIPDATRQRVLDAVARLGYAPSAAARHLRSGRSDTVLLLLPDWPIGHAIGQVITELSGELATAGLTLVTHPGARLDRPVSDLWKSINPVAVVAYDGFDDAESAAIRRAGIRLTILLIGGHSRDGVELGVPQQRIGRLQVEHLAATGHRDLGYAWPDDDRLARFAGVRLDGARQACVELGLAAPVVRSVPLDPDGAHEAVAAWRSDDAISGVCAYNDEVALAVLAGMRRAGLHAPADLAVIGADDIPAAALVDPALTTVAVHADVHARHLGRSIIRALAGDPPGPRPGSDPLDVVRREST